MSSKSLVLILGAGASSEVGLPVGDGLAQRIAEKLAFKFHETTGSFTSGDPTIYQALRLMSSGERGGNIAPLIEASKHISRGMPQAISIDNFIDNHRGNLSIAECGKLAIALCILQAEKSSLLKVDGSNIYNRLDFSTLKTTWFKPFFQLLTENCHQSDLAERFRRVGVITFNYDRCFEHFLYLSLQNYYEGMSAETAANLVSELEIYHAYGRVGSLPWMKQLHAVDFGAVPQESALIDLSKQIQTFTEGSSDTSDASAIRTLASGAERLVFLGFAFHNLNLDLMFGAPFSGDRLKNLSRRVFATGFGMSASGCKHVEAGLIHKAGFFQGSVHISPEMKCTDLLREYRRDLSLVMP